MRTRFLGLLRAAVPDRRRNAFDRLIAAHALAVDAVLVTHNEADRESYPGLRVENRIQRHEKGPGSGAFS